MRPKKNLDASFLRVTILGTGTSQGIPVIGCHCEVCRSDDPRDQRLRTSALIQVGDCHIVIDCGPDFRQQMLRTGTEHLHAILITHEHNDHVMGMDDVRPFNFMQKCDMPIFSTVQVAQELRARFAYAFETNPYPGAPRLMLYEINAQTPFYVEGVEIQPIEVQHGQLSVLGFRIGRFVYITDMKHIAPSELWKLTNCDTLVVNALNQQGHHSHLSLTEALDFIRHIRPRQAFITHISHTMGRHSEVSRLLPHNVALAWDGLSFEVPLL